MKQEDQFDNLTATRKLCAESMVSSIALVLFASFDNSKLFFSVERKRYALLCYRGFYCNNELFDVKRKQSQSNFWLSVSRFHDV